jgi:hypothetical protein
VKINVRPFALTLAALAGAAWGSPVLAQTTAPPPRPTKGLFANSKPTTSGQSLNLNVTFLEAYDDDVLTESGPTITPTAPPLSGYYSMLQTAVDFGWHGQKTQVAVTGSSALRYYNDLQEVKTASSSVGAGFATNLGQRTRWSFNQTAVYSPSYFYGLFPSSTPVQPGDLPVTADPNYTLNSQESYSYATSTSVSHGFSQRGSLAVSGDFTYTDFVQQIANRRDLRTFRVRTEYSRSFSRNSAFKIGYRFQRGDMGVTGFGESNEHGIDVGIATSHPLSATRRATFAFSFGSSAVEVPDVLLTGLLQDATLRTDYRVSADVTAGYQLNRTWQTRATYRRGLDYVPSLAAPIFADSANVLLEGLFTPRIGFNLGGGYSNGKSVLRTASTYVTYTGDVRLRYALTRRWGVFAEYLYYFYDFSGSSVLALPPGMSPGLERNGVHVGLTLWTPLLGR